jgi:methylglutaconyl-CoA hydratase
MATQDSSGNLTISIHNKVATITFFHPSSNALPRNLLDNLAQNIYDLGNNNQVQVIVLTSQGSKTFCAGASFDELLAIKTAEQGTHFFTGFAHLINAMRTCPKIIIGRIQGKAVGGGVGIIAACDYAFATHESSIKLSEIAIGIGPFVIEPVVSLKIGKVAMASLSLNPTQWKTADWSQHNGLFALMAATQDELDELVYQKANELANYNHQALSELKKIFWENTQHWNELLPQRAQISGKLVLSDFTKNALQQFKNK